MFLIVKYLIEEMHLTLQENCQIISKEVISFTLTSTRPEKLVERLFSNFLPLFFLGEARGIMGLGWCGPHNSMLKSRDAVQIGPGGTGKRVGMPRFEHRALL